MLGGVLMCPYLKMSQAVNSRFNDRVKRYCTPLFECFNLSHFWYYKLTNEGFLVTFGVHAEWVEFFAAQKFHLKYPFLRHPKHLRKMVNLYKNVEGGEVFASCKDLFGMQQSLQIVTKTEGGVEEFGFSSQSSSEVQTALFLNEMPLLRLFFKKFREDNAVIFSELEDYQVNVAEMIGPSFYEPSKMVPQLAARQLFLKKMGIEIEGTLSGMEARVIQLVLKGYSASQIGRHVFRSKRTVEHCIERIKGKLACNSKTELIQKARELEQVGYFSS